MPLLSASEWSDFLEACPRAHLLQTAAWGELKSSFGWQVARLASEEGGKAAGAQVFFRPLAPGFSLAYIPKGPLVRGQAQASPEERYRLWQALWPEVDRLCRRKRAVFLKVEPDDLEDGAAAPPGGFRPSPHAIQPPRTLLIDLSGDEESLLMRMKQKTRYNIRLARRKGIVVRASADLDQFYRLMQVTRQRDRFGVHSQDYYRRAFELFHPRGECELLAAEFEGETLAAIMVFLRGKRAWYFYGASGNEQRQLMPAYLLQWEAMLLARSRGCEEYDLWGVPDADEQSLEANFQQRSSGLWGIYRFKRGFGGRLYRSAGPWDRVYLPAPYGLYRWWVARRPQE